MEGQEQEIDMSRASDAPVRQRSWPLWLGAVLGLLIAWNAIVAIPVIRALSEEKGATTFVYRHWLVSPNRIVFDVWSVDGSQAMVDMDRRLFKAAEALQEKKFDAVVLAYRGEGKLVLDGGFFQEVGATRQTQNPLYLVRAMQEHVTNLDGSPAFDTWTGGWLGVLGKQMEDHNEFHNRWWLRAALEMHEGATMPSADGP